MSTIHDYNLAAVQVILGSFRITGWAEDDAVSIVPSSDLIESASSGDGSHVAISRTTDPRHTATLTVMRGTAAFRQIMEALQDQVAESDAGAVSPLAFQVYDPVEGTKISEANARFVRQPDLTFGRATGTAEFQLLLPSPTIVAGSAVAIT